MDMYSILYSYALSDSDDRNRKNRIGRNADPLNKTYII
jgi:hypothetical protein